MARARWQATIVDGSGNLLPSVNIEVRDEETNSLAIPTADRDGLDPLGNPFPVTGGFAAFYVPPGVYRIEAYVGAEVQTYRYVVLPGSAAAMDVADTAAVRAGAAKGPITPDAVLAAMEPVPLTDGASITIDHDDGCNRAVTIQSNPTFAAPLNPKPGWPLNVLITQGTGGNHVPAWNAAFKFGADGAPVLSTAAGARDLLAFVCWGAGDYVFLGMRKGV